MLCTHHRSSQYGIAQIFRSLLISLSLFCFLQANSFGQALPSPKDIQNAVEAGRYTQAEAMLKEVLHDKPSSAKAHYELGQVLERENRLSESRQELLEAQRLDPSLKFAKSPERFNEILEKVSVAENKQATAPTQTANQPNMRAQGPAQAQQSFPWGYVVIAIVVMLILGFIIRRMAPPPVIYGPAQPPYGPPGPMGPGGGPGYGPAPGYGPNYGPNYGPGYAPSGSGIGGAVVGGLAGVAAGYALSRAMEGGEHQGGVPNQNANPNNGGYIPMDQPQQPPNIGPFDQGSGSGWGDNSSGGGGGSDDDNW